MSESPHGMWSSRLMFILAAAGFAVTIVVLDTAVALLFGMVNFPIVFAHGLEPSAGPGLMFITLPLAFGQMAGGQLFGTLFFLLVSLAVITSAISMGEPTVACLVEKVKGSRTTGAIIVGGLAWQLGLGSAFSFNIWSDVTLLPGRSFFDTIDFVSNNVILPFGGFLIGLFAGWFLDQKILTEQLEGTSEIVIKLLRVLMRIIAPVCIFVVFVMTFVS